MARLTIVSIPALDHYSLETTHYCSLGGSCQDHLVVINSGAGIPRSFYEPFASWLADEGFYVITYDYRGIGGSRGESLRRLSASISDWGSKDCAAVLAIAKQRFPRAKIYVLGHSIGGLVTGFVKEAPNIERMLLVSPHTGYLGDYAQSSKPKMFLVWHVMMPIVTRAVGYFPGRLLGLPEDIPYGVAIEWAQRRFGSNLTKDAQYGDFRQIKTNALVLRPGDDPFATAAAAERVRARFPNTQFAELTLPAHAKTDTKRIGHFGFFRAQNRENLWPIALRWFANGRWDQS